MVRISDIQGGEVLWATVPYCRINKDEIDSYLLKKNDILFARTGGTVGKSFLVKEIPYPTIYAGYLIRTRYSQLLSAQYMKYFMESQLYWEQLKNGTIATAQPNCNGKTLSKMILPIPPYNEQVRITNKLNEVLAVVNKYGACQDRLSHLNCKIKNSLLKSILQEAIQGKLVKQDPNEEPASVLLERIKQEKERLIKEKRIKRDKQESIIYRGDDNKYFEKRGKEIACIDDEIPFIIPDSWEWVRFGSLINMRIGKTPPRGDVNFWSNGTTPWISISDMSDYGIIKHTKEQVSDFAIKTAFSSSIVPAGTLIMSFKLTVGRTSILDIDAVHNEAIISIKPYVDSDDSLRDYLFYILPLISNFGDSKDAIKGKTLNSTSLFNLLIPLPPLAEQRRIVNAIIRLWQVL